MTKLLTVLFAIMIFTAAGFAQQFGLPTDIPVPGDYDGDGKADIAVFRPSNGTWYVLRSDGSFTATQFGQAGDKPVPADWHGSNITNQHRTNFAVFRGNPNGSATWFIAGNTPGSSNAVGFGYATDTPVPADYDGDGRADVGVFRPSTGWWYIF